MMRTIWIREWKIHLEMLTMLLYINRSILDLGPFYINFKWYHTTFACERFTPLTRTVILLFLDFPRIARKCPCHSDRFNDWSVHSVDKLGVNIKWIQYYVLISILLRDYLTFWDPLLNSRSTLNWTSLFYTIKQPPSPNLLPLCGNFVLVLLLAPLSGHTAVINSSLKEPLERSNPKHKAKKKMLSVFPFCLQGIQPCQTFTQRPFAE